MTATQIKTMTAAECFKRLDYIELSAKVAGKELTVAQKKEVKALESRLDVLMPDD